MTSTPNETQGLPSELLLLLGRIDGKLDSALSRLDRHEQDHKALVLRVSALEKGRAYLLGAAAAAGGVASYVKGVFLG